MVIIVVLYFGGVASALALWCLPTVRQRAFSALGRGSFIPRGSGRCFARRAVDTAGGSASLPGFHPVPRSLARLHPGWTTAMAVLLVVPGTAFVVRHWHAYDGFDHTVSREVDTRIAELLRGEQLALPARLPPDLFTTREVEQAHPLAASASRQWELLDPQFRQRLLIVFKLMREHHGYDMVLIEGWRSRERQAQLAALGPTVTRAAAGQSYHQAGLAADCAFLRNGRVIISEKDPWAAEGYRLYGAAAQAVGLTWGGSWRTLVDLGHVELKRQGVLSPASTSTMQRS